MGHHQVGINIGPVHLFDFQAYECNGCGRCCDKPWKVTIDPHQLAGIEASAAYQRRTRPGFVPLAVEDGGFARLAHTESGGCVFRDQEKRCSLHAELGLYGKPRGCQLFPYQPQDTPDGTYVHLSFGCPQVVAGSGRGVEEDRAHLAHVLAYRRALAPVPGVDDFTVQLTQDVSISWESYLKLEERILQAFDLSNPCESLLKTVLAILRCDADQPWPDLTPTRAEDISFAQEMLAKFLGNIAASLEVLENEDDWQAFSRAVESGQPVASQEFGTVIPGMSLEAPAEEFLREIINRYVRNAVLGKALLKSTVVERLLVCACVIPLVSFYGRAYQTARDESSLTLEAVTLAFEKIEIGVATHTRSLAHVFAGMADTFAEIAALPEEWL